MHITEVNEDNVVVNPFSAYKVGHTLTARVVFDSVKSAAWVYKQL